MAFKKKLLQTELEAVKAGCLELSQGQLTLYTLLENFHGASLESKRSRTDIAGKAVRQNIEKVLAIGCGLKECLQRPLVSEDIEEKLSTCLDRTKETIEAIQNSRTLPGHAPQLDLRQLALISRPGIEADTATAASLRASVVAPSNITFDVGAADGSRSPIRVRFLSRSPAPPASSSTPAGSHKSATPPFELARPVKERQVSPKGGIKLKQTVLPCFVKKTNNC